MSSAEAPAGSERAQERSPAPPLPRAIATNSPEEPRLLLSFRSRCLSALTLTPRLPPQWGEHRATKGDASGSSYPPRPSGRSGQEPDDTSGKPRMTPDVRYSTSLAPAPQRSLPSLLESCSSSTCATCS